MLQRLLRHAQRDGLPGEGRHCDQPSQRALQFTDVRLGLRGDEDAHVLWQVDPFRLGLLSRMAILVSRSGACTSTINPHSKRERSRSTKPDSCSARIAGDHDLFVVIIQFVESVEELFLGPFFPGQNVNVVDQQHIRRTIVAMKRRHAIRA